MARPLQTSTSRGDHQLTDSEEAVNATCTESDVNFLLDLAEALDGQSEVTENASQDRLLELLQHRGRSLPTSSFTPGHNSFKSLPPQWTNMISQLPDANNSHQGDECVAGEESKTRSEAITLIRARTITRSSPTEASFQADMPIDNHLPPPVSDNVLPPVALMDLIQKPKKKRPSKIKSKRQKPKRRDVSKSQGTKDSGPSLTDDANEKDVATVSSNEQDTHAPTLTGSEEPSSTELLLPDFTNASPADKSIPGACTKESDPKSHEDAAVNHEVSQQDGASQVPSALSFAAVLAGNLDNLELNTNGPNLCNGAHSTSDEMTSTTPVNADSKYAFKPNETTQLDGVSISIDVNNLQGLTAAGRSRTLESSSQSSLGASQSSRKTATQKEKLPAIRETSPEVKGGSSVQGCPSASSQSLTCTPKSTSTGLSAWNAFSQQNTPRTDISEDSELKRTKGKKVQKQLTSTQTKSSVQANGNSSHAHPSTSVDVENQGSISSKKKSKSSQKKDRFVWNLDSHGFPCAKEGCDKRCNLWDGVTVICPCCGPYSECRYCCKEHLLSDIKPHWTICGQMTFRHPCKESTIPKTVRNGPSFVPCLHPYDTPERHRQAVYLNMNSQAGDYFVFSDWADNVEAGFPENNVALRCSNRVVYIIKFDNPEEKDRFRRVLAACLFMTIEVTELVDYLYRLIRDKLRSERAPADLETAVQYQFFQEFAVTIQAAITGQRHACETDWDGRNRRNCPDPVCRAEYRRLLGSLGGKGHRQLIDHLEGSYWILRAARATHPDVKDTIARMGGDGFDEVAEEDRRVFRRGEGWDGAGTGKMEIEGINA